MGEGDLSAKKDFWDIVRIVAGAAGVVAIPVVLGIVGFEVNLSLKERDVRLRTVELAVGILQENPQASPETPVLREWAMDVIDNYSGVPLPKDARSELLSKPLPELARMQIPDYERRVDQILRRAKGPPPGRVKIRSIPPGAEIFVDGLLQVQRTNDTLWLSEGSHVIQIRIGSQTRDVQIEVVSGETYEIEEVFTQ